MAVVGSATIQLLLDRKKFNQDLRQTLNLDLPPLRIGLEVDGSDLRSQIQRQTANLPSATTPSPLGPSAPAPVSPPELPQQPTPDDGGLLRSLDQQAQGFKKSVDAAAAYTLALSEVGQQLSNAGARVNDFSGQALTAANAFDSATQKVATLTSDSAGLADATRQLAADLDFQANSTDLLNASYDVLSAGFSDTADVTQILDAAVKGATGGFSDVGTVADATTTILNAYGKSAGDAAAVVDVLSATQNAGKITIDQYAGLIGQVASTAAAAGVPLEELSAFIATATATGVQAGPAITGLRQAIASIQKPAKASSDLAADLGVQFDGTALKSKGLAGVLEEVRAALAAQGREGELNDVLLKLFGSTEAVAAILPSAGEGAENYARNLDAITNSAGTAAAASDEVAQSFDSRVSRALNQSNEALVSLGQGVQKAIIPLLDALTFLVENFNRLPAPVKEAVGVVVALTGGLLTVAGAIASVAAILPVVKAGLTALLPAGTAAGAGLVGTAGGAGAASASLGTMTAALGPLLIKLGLVLAAVEAVKLALSRFADGGAEFKEGAATIEQSLIDLQVEAGNTRAALESALPEDPPPTDWLDRIADGLGLQTNADKQLTDLREGVVQFQNTIDNVTSQSYQFRVSLGAEVDEGELQQAQKFAQTLDTAIEETQARLEGLDASKLGSKAYAELSTQLQNTITVLEAEKSALERNAGIAQDSSDATDSVTEATDSLGAAIEATTGEAQDLSDALSSITDSAANDIGEAEGAAKAAQARIASLLNGGGLTSDQAREQTLAAEKQFLDERVSINQAAIADLEALEAAATTDSEREQIGAEIVALETDIADARIEQIEKVGKARQEAEKAAVDAAKTAAAEAQAVNKLEQAELAEQVNQGLITEEQARQQALVAEQTYLQARIDANRQAVNDLQALAGQTSNPEEVARINAQITALDSATADDRKALAAQVATARQEAEQAALEAVQRANQQALAAVEQSQQQRVAAIKQAQVDGVISAEEAAQQITQVEEDAIAQRITAKENELASVRQLQADGLLSATEAADQEAALIAEIGALNIERLDAELAAQQALQDAAVERYDQEIGLIQQRNQLAQQGLDIARDSIQQQSALLNAQGQLAGNLNTLEEERLRTRIAQAEAAGDTAQADQLKVQLAETERENLAEQFALKRQQLQLSIQQAEIEARRQVILAQVALAEAQIEVQKARAAGATADEIALLQSVVGLQEQALGVAENGVETQRQIGAAQLQSLAVEEAIATERQNQSDIGLRESLGDSSALASLGEVQVGTGPVTPAATVGLPQDIAAQVAAAEALAPTVTATPDSLTVDITPLRDEINGLRTAIEDLAASPRQLTVQTPDPVADITEVLGGISKQARRNAGV